MSKAKMQQIPKDTIILREGEKSRVMYKILKGHAEVYFGYGTETESLLGIIGEGSCFGEFGLLLNKPAIYTVIAYSDMLVLTVTEADIGEFIIENNKNILDIMKNMAGSMMSMRLQIEQLAKELDEQQVINKSNTVMRNNLLNAKQIMREYAIQTKK